MAMRVNGSREEFGDVALVLHCRKLGDFFIALNPSEVVIKWAGVSSSRRPFNEEVRHEATIPRTLSHNNILKVLDTFSIGTDFNIVFEYYLDSDLYELVPRLSVSNDVTIIKLSSSRWSRVSRAATLGESSIEMRSLKTSSSTLADA
ncbi:MAG: hypothetical protein M1834_005051 [Cirrosporium novae-zelandiae]|nr:MAG: hypothetical protein M1834_005051 [Cirrosporium novae-zelandiae]